ncbi:MAG: hypothetical protein FWD45_04030 [Coriobacteriia bacterium]|nr:hypothetical protein [Coriobacteriia bacterium]
MKTHRQAVLSILLILVLCLTGCKPQASSTDPEEKTEESQGVLAQEGEGTTKEKSDASSAMESGGNPDARLYSDPAVRLNVMLTNQDWSIYKDRETGQVYFYLSDDPTRVNMISMSSRAMEADFEVMAEDYWQYTSLIMTREYDMEIDEKCEIVVGSGYTGHVYHCTIAENEGISHYYIMYWSAEGFFYICTVTADPEHKQEVDDVLAELLNSFFP